jgi:hypothetical protein
MNVFQGGAMIELLQDMGIMLCIPRDVWTTELSDTYAYVLVKDLPYYPDVDVVCFLIV